MQKRWRLQVHELYPQLQPWQVGDAEARQTKGVDVEKQFPGVQRRLGPCPLVASRRQRQVADELGDQDIGLNYCQQTRESETNEKVADEPTPFGSQAVELAPENEAGHPPGRPAYTPSS